ncbi:hypothetical protein ACNOYE_31395 [Nannocystaceae bacterium ST9]
MSEQSTPGVAGALVARLAAAGRQVDSGSFTIDVEQARVRLREQRLADAHAWVALIVEAASLAGSPTVYFQLGAQRSSARFKGPPLDPARLEQLFAAAFVDVDRLDEAQRMPARVLERLAIAANAALTLDCSAVLIECHTAQGQRRRMTVEPDGPIAVEAGEGEPDDEIRFVLVGEGRDSERANAELALLRQRCRWAKPKIDVDGTAINETRAAALGAGSRMAISDGHGKAIGLARLGHGGQPGRLLLLTNGVLAETLPLPEAPTDFLALVDVDLRKDLAQSRVVRDAAFDRMLIGVRGAWERLGRRPATTATQRKAVLKEVHANRPDFMTPTRAFVVLLALTLIALLVLWLR